tara:strand:- start:651 stop:866 length:216 start_codon:yes stop_codon:yes gene_type:complete
MKIADIIDNIKDIFKKDEPKDEPKENPFLLVPGGAEDDIRKVMSKDEINKRFGSRDSTDWSKDQRTRDGWR